MSRTAIVRIAELLLDIVKTFKPPSSTDHGKRKYIIQKYLVLINETKTILEKRKKRKRKILPF